MGNQILNVYRVRMPDGLRDVVSLLPMESGFTEGLAPESIVGSCPRLLEHGEKVSPNNFARNPVFVKFLHGVIARRGHEVPALQAAARGQKEGWIYIIDARTPNPQGEVPPHDIIGGFQVKAGAVIAGSYKANPNHLLLSVEGLFQLDAALHQLLMEEIVLQSRSVGTAAEDRTATQKPWWKVW